MQGSKPTVEQRRMALQVELDAQRSSSARNQLGQFATPTHLACDIMSYALKLHGDRPVRFLEPSSGSGAFISALFACSPTPPSSVVGYELDPRFVSASRSLWGERGAEIVEGDFLSMQPRKKATLVVANPPYSRHHHLTSEQKRSYKQICERATGLSVSGLSGLYVYFILAAHAHLAPGALSVWLIPSEFLDVNFGVALKQYLTQNVTLHRIHRFAPEGGQFPDAMITSSVVVFTNTAPSTDHVVEFSAGGTVSKPERVESMSYEDPDPNLKWSPAFNGHDIQRVQEAPRFDEFFTIRRGVVTGNNKFFVRPREELEKLGICAENITPLIPSSRYVKVEVVETDEQGFPSNVQQLGLINATVGEDLLAQKDPALAQYFASAEKKVREGYLVRNRSPWYRQEVREPAPILLTYMGRSHNPSAAPFRFIGNKSQAIATNGYLMLYPKGQLKHALEKGFVTLEDVLEVLNSITPHELRNGGRVYGGGLHKVEPKELAAMDASTIAALIPEYAPLAHSCTLF